MGYTVAPIILKQITDEALMDKEEKPDYDQMAQESKRNLELRNENERLKEEVEEWMWEVVGYGASQDRETGEIDSCALSGVADAIRRLAELGKLEIIHDVGRRVIAKRKG